jgi:hypothetical protein
VRDSKDYSFVDYGDGGGGDDDYGGGARLKWGEVAVGLGFKKKC